MFYKSRIQRHFALKNKPKIEPIENYFMVSGANKKAGRKNSEDNIWNIKEDIESETSMDSTEEDTTKDLLIERNKHI